MIRLLELEGCAADGASIDPIDVDVLDAVGGGTADTDVVGVVLVLGGFILLLLLLLLLLRLIAACGPRKTREQLRGSALV